MQENEKKTECLHTNNWQDESKNWHCHECGLVQLKGIGKLSESEYLVLGSIRAGVQNDLGENADLLQKYNLQYVG